jgi:hypothetical protein
MPRLALLMQKDAQLVLAATNPTAMREAILNFTSPLTPRLWTITYTLWRHKEVGKHY